MRTTGLLIVRSPGLLVPKRFVSDSEETEAASLSDLLLNNTPAYHRTTIGFGAKLPTTRSDTGDYKTRRIGFN